MRRERALWALLLSFSIIGFISFVRANRIRVIEQSFAKSGKPSPQKMERVWRQIPIVQSATIGTASTSRLVNPLRVQATEGHVFILDWGDKSIKKFSLKGDLIKEYRALKDKTTAEALAPTHFTVGKDGEVWVCYQQGGVVKRFSNDGIVLQSFHVQRLPHRVVPVFSGGFVVMGGDPGSDLFQRYDVNGRLVGSFGRILDGEIQHPLVLDGAMAVSDNLIYASRYAGILASYSPSGRLNYMTQTIDPSPLPSLWVNGSGHWRVEPGAPLKSLSLSVSNEKIYIMSERHSKASRNRVLDVYSEVNGKYLYSFSLPEHTRHAVVMEDRLYTVGDNKVTCWQIEEVGQLASWRMSAGLRNEWRAM